MARTAKRYQRENTSTGEQSLPCFCVGIYSRLSVDHDDRKSESIENQIENVKRFIEENNADTGRKMNLVIHDIYIDRGTSGMSFERPDFDRLMQDVKERRVNCVIVKDLSRFGRDYVEAGKLIEKVFPFLGCRFIAVTDHFDSMAVDAEGNKFVMNIKNLINEMYAKDISKRVSIARNMSATAGSFIGSFAPYGYKVVRDGEIRRLEIVEECAGIVRRIFARFNEGAAYKEIIAELYEDKIHNISDYKRYGHIYQEAGEELHQWSHGSLYKILRNKTYLGMLQQCQNSQLAEKETISENGSGTRERRGIVVYKTHEPIVSEEVFETVKRRLDKPKTVHVSNRTAKEDENIFRNLIYCGNCGKKMHSYYYQCRQQDERHYGYDCKNEHVLDERKCERNRISETAIMKIVQEELYRILRQENVQQNDLISLTQEAYEKAESGYQKEEQEIQVQLSQLRKQASMYYAQWKEGVLRQEDYELFRRRKTEQEDFLEIRKTELEEKKRKLKERLKQEYEFLSTLIQVREDKKLTMKFAETLIDKILVYPNKTMDIHFRFSRGGTTE